MKIEENVKLAPYTTLGVGGPARYFVVINDTDELKESIQFAREKKIPVFVLGEGANILVSDEGFDGLVIHLNIRNISFEEQSADIVKVTVSAGTLWDDLVRACVEKGLRGMESTSGIPGSVGAAVVGNIAAYGQSVSDTLEYVKIIDIDNIEKGVERIDVSELGLCYRYSDFQDKKLASKIIISATFVLDKQTVPKLEYKSALKVARELGFDYENNVEEHREVILEARKRAGSLLENDNGVNSKTAGSFFRNPKVSVKLAEKILCHEEFGVSKTGILKQNKIHGGTIARVSAAHVLLAAGFKREQRWGNVRLHSKHILKIENIGDATAQDIYNVSKEIILTVKNKLGIQLEPEVRFVGQFKQ